MSPHAARVHVCVCVPRFWRETTDCDAPHPPRIGHPLMQMFMVSFVFNVIKGAIGGASGSSSKSKSQDWDDL